MKTILAATLLLAGLSVHAADELVLVAKCQSIQMMPDNSYSVGLYQGGIAGGYQLQVSHSTFVGPETTSYLVQKLPPEPRRMGAPVVYEGPGVRFLMNFTVRPPAPGATYGRLEQVDAAQNKSSVDLACKVSP